MRAEWIGSISASTNGVSFNSRDGGARVMLDIPDNALDAALTLAAMRGMALRVTVEVDGAPSYAEDDYAEDEPFGSRLADALDALDAADDEGIPYEALSGHPTPLTRAVSDLDIAREYERHDRAHADVLSEETADVLAAAGGVVIPPHDIE